jgi:hypothetical protein
VRILLDSDSPLRLLVADALLEANHDVYLISEDRWPETYGSRRVSMEGAAEAATHVAATFITLPDFATEGWEDKLMVHLLDRADDIITLAHATGSRLLSIVPPAPWPNQRAIAAYSAKTLAATYAIRDGLRVAFARLFNVFGPGIHTGVVWEFARRLKHKEPFAVYMGGSQVVDLVPAAEAMRALNDIVASDLWDGQTIDIGSGFGTAVTDLARLMWERAGNDGQAPVVHLGTRAGEGWDHPVAERFLVRPPTMVRSELAEALHEVTKEALRG